MNLYLEINTRVIIDLEKYIERQGCVVALDKSSKNFERLKHNISSQGLSTVHCFRADATKSFSEDADILKLTGML